MKSAFITSFLITSALAVSACGGGSSSDSSYQATVKLGSDSWTCMSESAFNTCEADKDQCDKVCKADTNNTPPKPTNPNACEVSGDTVYGTENGCVFKDESKDADAVLTCSGKMITVDGKVGKLNSQNGSFSSGANIYGTILDCK